MPNPNPIPVTFPTNNKACPKCGYSVNYPSDGQSGLHVVGMSYDVVVDKIKLTCNKCTYSVLLPPAS